MPQLSASGSPSSRAPPGGISSAWPTILASAFVLLCLAALAIAPIWTGRRTMAPRTEIGSVAEPMDLLADRLEFAFALQEAGLRGYLLTGEERHVERYREARAEEERLFRRLDRIARQLDASIVARLDEVRKRAARRHLREDAFLGGRISRERFLSALPEQDALYQSVLAAALALDRALVEAIDRRRDAIDAAERFHRRLSLLLASSAFVAVGGVTWLTRRARRLAAANARLYRESWEAEQRWRFLAEASSILGASLDYTDTLQSLARLVVPRGADWCVVDVVEARRQDGVEQIATAHADPEKEELLRELRRRHPLDWTSMQPAARALRTGEPVFIPEISNADLAESSRTAEQIRRLRELGLHSLIAVPLVARGHVLGTMTFVSAAPNRTYDVHDLKLAQELAVRAALAVDNARLYEAAVAASKAKSDFLAVMSHELRTPLNVITGNADLLEAEIAGSLTEKQKDFVQRIKTSAWNQLRIIEEILTFSRMELGREQVQIERVDLSHLVRDLVPLVEPLAREKGLHFRIDAPEEPTPVETDPRKLRHILLNLLSNAMKFTEEGEVELQAAVEEGTTILRLRDTGIGIAPEYLEKIFEPFFQVEEALTREKGGTGLGLSVARRIAHLLGGEITVQSEVGKGSTFTVRLPRRPPAPAPSARFSDAGPETGADRVE